MENDNPKHACPHCGGAEFITEPNSYDRYMAIGDKLCWQKTELAHTTDGALYCAECDERIELSPRKIFSGGGPFRSGVQLPTGAGRPVFFRRTDLRGGGKNSRMTRL